MENDYFEDKYYTLNHLEGETLDIFNKMYLKKKDIVFFKKLFLQKVYKKRYEKKIFFDFGYLNYSPESFNEVKTFKEYFSKAKERIKILKSEDFSNIDGIDTREMVDKLIKVFQELDEQVEDFKNIYGNTDGLTEDDFKNARLKINETINKIFFINN